jgi:acetyl-CoA carboxylase carboxyltransferase component
MPTVTLKNQTLTASEERIRDDERRFADHYNSEGGMNFHSAKMLYVQAMIDPRHTQRLLKTCQEASQ